MFLTKIIDHGNPNSSSLSCEKAEELNFSCAAETVEKRYVWLYATCQLALVVCFAHIFYDVVGVH
jgi:hypothetical protein